VAARLGCRSATWKHANVDRRVHSAGCLSLFFIQRRLLYCDCKLLAASQAALRTWNAALIFVWSLLAGSALADTYALPWPRSNLRLVGSAPLWPKGTATLV
jgi:hypothetical protein